MAPFRKLRLLRSTVYTLRSTSTPRATRFMTNMAKANEALQLANVYDVSKLTAVVTGGGTGIGLMCTQALVANGATVYITGRRVEALNSVVEQYNTGPGKIVAAPCDISQKDEVLRLAESIRSQEQKGIQLLVNNAGVARDDNTKYTQGKPDFSSAESVSSHLLKSESQQWGETFQTNVVAQYFTTAAFLPLLKTGSSTIPGYSSSVINIASISGVMKGSSAGQFAYGASKAAFIHLTRTMASTFVSIPVRVNCIAPGIFPSEMTTGSSGDDQKSELPGKRGNPAGRAGNDVDMAGCLLFLAGPSGTFLNAQVLYPDGGNILVQPAAT